MSAYSWHYFAVIIIHPKQPCNPNEQYKIPSYTNNVMSSGEQRVFKMCAKGTEAVVRFYNLIVATSCQEMDFIKKNPTRCNNVSKFHYSVFIWSPTCFGRHTACSASYKYGRIKCWYIVASCWIFLYELYYDARIHERQEMDLSVQDRTKRNYRQGIDRMERERDASETSLA